MSEEDNVDLSGKGKFYDNLRDLITLVDDLRDCGLNKLINLPRIAVIGSQSAGKSSVLESIVGIDFLPRGEGVCTRRPLELRLVHVPDSEASWAIFDEIPNKKFTDFSQVKDNIQQLTNSVAGGQKNIVDQPIVLAIQGRTCPDLTLIDIPGITRIPLKNDGQSDNIEQITREMSLRQIKDERTVILAVIPANQDISTSDGLQMAKEIDKAGKRTIGVITKIDIMDRGTNAKHMLEGRDIPLTLGQVGVVNRSQGDINGNVRVRKALEAEKMFFSSTSPQNTMAHHLLGTEPLVEKLTTVLFGQIKGVLPEIIKETGLKIKEAEQRLKELGPSMPEKLGDKIHLLHKLITDFSEAYKSTISGKFDKRNQDVLKDSSNKKLELSGGARIRLMLTSLFDDKQKEMETAYKDDEIRRAITLHAGDAIPGFHSVDVFQALIHPKLELLKDPCEECLNEIYFQLEGMANSLIEKIFRRFPSIIAEVSEVILRIMQKDRDVTMEQLNSIIEAEENYIQTCDSEGMNKNTAQDRDNDKNKLSSDQRFINDIKIRINNYFAIVLRNLKDTVPKVIGQWMVKKSEENMSFEVWQAINENQDIQQMLTEPNHIRIEREQLTKQIEILNKAKKVIKRDPHLSRTLQSQLNEDGDNKFELIRKDNTKKLAESSIPDRDKEETDIMQQKTRQRDNTNMPDPKPFSDETRQEPVNKGSLISSFGKKYEPSEQNNNDGKKPGPLPLRSNK